MPLYAYRAIDQSGKKSHGTLDAANENELFGKLQQQGKSLLDCTARAVGTIGKKMPLAEQIAFCRHFSAMQQAGIPAQQALADMAQENNRGSGAKILPALVAAVAGGQSLSAAFSQLPLRMDPLVVFMLKAGEKTGRLGENMQRLTQALEWKNQFQSELRKSLSYPLLQLLLAGIAIAVLLGVAVPQIVNLLQTMGDGLPWYASAIILFMKGMGWALAFAALLTGLAFLAIPVMHRVSPDAACAIDRVVLGLPLMGPLVLKSELAQMMHVFASLLDGGTSVMDALQDIPEFVSNRALAHDLAQVRVQVAGGQGISSAFRESMKLPLYVQRLLQAGEDGRDIRTSLFHIAALYQTESRQAVEVLLKGSSTGITLTVGLLLAAMVVGVIYPLYAGLSAMMSQ